MALKLFRPAVEVESLPWPFVNGGVGECPSSERPLLEPIVDDRPRLFRSIGGANAGEEPDERNECTELFLMSGPAAAAKLMEAAARAAEEGCLDTAGAPNSIGIRCVSLGGLGPADTGSGEPILKPLRDRRGAVSAGESGGDIRTGKGNKDSRCLCRRESHGNAEFVWEGRGLCGLSGLSGVLGVAPNEVLGRTLSSDLDESDFLPKGSASDEAVLEWSMERDSSPPSPMRLPANRRSSSAGSLDLPNVPNRDFLFSAFTRLSDDFLSSIEGRPEEVSTTIGPSDCFCRVKGWNLRDLVLCKVGFDVDSSMVGGVMIMDGAGALLSCLFA